MRSGVETCEPRLRRPFAPKSLHPLYIREAGVSSRKPCVVCGGELEAYQGDGVMCDLCLFGPLLGQAHSGWDDLVDAACIALRVMLVVGLLGGAIAMMSWGVTR